MSRGMAMGAAAVPVIHFEATKWIRGEVEQWKTATFVRWCTLGHVELVGKRQQIGKEMDQKSTDFERKRFLPAILGLMIVRGTSQHPNAQNEMREQSDKTLSLCGESIATMKPLAVLVAWALVHHDARPKPLPDRLRGRKIARQWHWDLVPAVVLVKILLMIDGSSIVYNA